MANNSCTTAMICGVFGIFAAARNKFKNGIWAGFKCPHWTAKDPSISVHPCSTGWGRWGWWSSVFFPQLALVVGTFCMQIENIFCRWQRLRWWWFPFLCEQVVSGLVYINFELNFLQWAYQSLQWLFHHNRWFIFFTQKSHCRNEIFINRNKFHYSNFP